jgi:hypothetical protein
MKDGDGVAGYSSDSTQSQGAGEHLSLILGKGGIPSTL